VDIRAGPVLTHENTAVLRIGPEGSCHSSPLILKKIIIYIQMKIFESRTHISTLQRLNVVSINTNTQTIQSIYTHVLDKYEQIEYTDNTINIQTNTINLQ